MFKTFCTLLGIRFISTFEANSKSTGSINPKMNLIFKLETMLLNSNTVSQSYFAFRLGPPSPFSFHLCHILQLFFLYMDVCEIWAQTKHLSVGKKETNDVIAVFLLSHQLSFVLLLCGVWVGWGSGLDPSWNVHLCPCWDLQMSWFV